jgi:hypothetical protein
MCTGVLRSLLGWLEFGHDRDVGVVVVLSGVYGVETG